MKRAKAEVLNTVQVSCGFPQNFEHDSGSRVSGDQQLPLRHAGIPTSWKFLVSTPKLAYSVARGSQRVPLVSHGFPQATLEVRTRRVSPVSRGFPSELLQRHPKFLDWTPKLGAQGFLEFLAGRSGFPWSNMPRPGMSDLQSRGFPSQLFKRHPVSLRQPGSSLRPSHLAVLWLAKK